MRGRASPVDELPVVEMQVHEPGQPQEPAGEHPERVRRGQLEQLGAARQPRRARPVELEARRAVGEIALPERRRRAVDVPERRERLCDRLVEVPAAAAEVARLEPALAQPLRLAADDRRRSTSPCRARLRRRRPSACGGRAARAKPRAAHARARASRPRPTRRAAGASARVTTKPPGRRSSSARSAPTRDRRAVARRGRRRPRSVQGPPRCASCQDTHLDRPRRRGRRRCRALSCSLSSAARSSAPSPRRATTSRRPSSPSGTFGFVPGHPSAYTQPLYGWFLVPLYWLVRPPLAGRSGWRRSLVAAATAILVLERGSSLPDARVGADRGDRSRRSTRT